MNGNKKIIKSFIAIYGYKKNGTHKIFEAEKKGQAEQMAKEYEKQSNKGEPKSERLKFIKVKQL